MAKPTPSRVASRMMRIKVARERSRRPVREGAALTAAAPGPLPAAAGPLATLPAVGVPVPARGVVFARLDRGEGAAPVEAPDGVPAGPAAALLPALTAGDLAEVCPAAPAADAPAPS